MVWFRLPHGPLYHCEGIWGSSPPGPALILTIINNRDTYNIIIDRLVHLVRTQFIQIEVVGSIPTLTAKVSLFNHNFINIGGKGIQSLWIGFP